MAMTEEIIQVFKQLDTDEDGQISYRDFNVFWHTCVRAEQVPTGKEVQSALSRSRGESAEGIMPLDGLVEIKHMGNSFIVGGT